MFFASKPEAVCVGEIAAVGTSPNYIDWAIGLANSEDGPAEATIHLRDRAVATSSPLGTLFGGRLVRHILDPESGMAALANWQRVSLIHPSAAIADEHSTTSVLQSVAVLRDMVTRYPGAAVSAI